MNSIPEPAPRRKGSRPRPVRTARVVGPCLPAEGDMLQEPGVIRLTVDGKSTDYAYDILAVDPRAGRFAVWMSKGPSHEGYDLLVAHDGGVTCDCPGHLRWGHCKHADAVVALIAASLLTPPAPATA